MCAPSSIFVLWTACLLAAPTLAAGPACAQEGRPGRAALNLLQDAFVAVADEVEPAVVTITSRRTVRPQPGRPAPDPDDEIFQGLPGRRPGRAFRAQGMGSGVIISADGWILTNDHVVGGADRVSVKLGDGREFDGVVRRDYRSDLALVKIEASNLRAARLGDSDKLKIGHWAIAIGSPYRYEGSFSVGVISSLFRRQQIMSASGGRLYPNMIQTDAAINPGNSGGPLVNIEGEVIGINTAIESDGGGSVGIGFAIPINVARFVAEELKSRGHVVYGYLGIDPDTVTPTLAAAYRVTDGALIRAEPDPDSPAGKAGIEAGDVITDVNGKPIHSELDLRMVIARMAPGSIADIRLVRSGREKKVRTVITEAPEIPREQQPGTPPMPAGLGIEVVDATADILKKAGLPETIRGVQVKTLDGGSAASESEIRPGDVILRVNAIDTPTAEEFKKATSSLMGGDVVRILWTGRRASRVEKRIANVKID